MEQILIRNLPTGTKAALKLRAEQHHRSIEAEARELLSSTLLATPATMPDLLAMPGGEDIDFTPERLGTTTRVADL